MAFTPYSPGTGDEHSELIYVPIANSVTITVGDLVRCAVSGATAGFLTNSASAASALGIVQGFGVNQGGIPVPPAAYVAGTAAGTDVLSVTTASDNQTTFARYALVEISREKKWSAQVNGTLGTTNTSPTAASRRFGGFINVDSGNTNYDRVLETSYIRSRSAGTVQNFYVWGVDPNDSTRLIVSLACSERIVEQT